MRRSNGSSRSRSMKTSKRRAQMPGNSLADSTKREFYHLAMLHQMASEGWKFQLDGIDVDQLDIKKTQEDLVKFVRSSMKILDDKPVKKVIVKVIDENG